MIAKLRVVFWIGIVLLFVPFIGIPESGKSIITVAIGIVIIILSLKLKRAHKELKFRLRRYEEPTTTTESINA